LRDLILYSNLKFVRKFNKFYVCPLVTQYQGVKFQQYRFISEGGVALTRNVVRMDV